MTRAVLAVALVMVSSGCVRYHLDVVAEADDTVNGSIVMAFDTDAMAAMTGLGSMTTSDESNPLAEIETDFEAMKARMTAGTVELEPYQQEEFNGYRIAYTDVPFADLGPMLGVLTDDEASGTMTIRRDAGRFVFDATSETDGAADASEAAFMRMLLRDADMRISIAFPGPVQEANGQVSGNTVTWGTEQILDGTAMRAVGDASPPALLTGAGAPYVIVWVSVLLAAGLALLVLATRRRAAKGPKRGGSLDSGSQW